MRPVDCASQPAVISTTNIVALIASRSRSVPASSASRVSGTSAGDGDSLGSRLSPILAPRFSGSNCARIASAGPSCITTTRRFARSNCSRATSSLPSRANRTSRSSVGQSIPGTRNTVVFIAMPCPGIANGGHSLQFMLAAPGAADPVEHRLQLMRPKERQPARLGIDEAVQLVGAAEHRRRYHL